VLVGIHDASSYLLLALTVGHVALALKHGLLDRDGIFDRIVPRNPRRSASR
jgi:cytochrome b561